MGREEIRTHVAALASLGLPVAVQCRAVGATLWAFCPWVAVVVTNGPGKRRRLSDTAAKHGRRHSLRSSVCVLVGCSVKGTLGDMKPHLQKSLLIYLNSYVCKSFY